MLSLLFILPFLFSPVWSGDVDGTFTWTFTEILSDGGVIALPASSPLPSCSPVNLAIYNPEKWPLLMLTVPSTGYPSIQTIAQSEGTNSSIYLPYSHDTDLSFFLFDADGNLSPSSVGLTYRTTGVNNCQQTEDGVTFSINATKIEGTYTLLACQTLGIDISGGSPPYTVNIVEWGQSYDQNALNVMNIQLPGDDNHFSWVNNIPLNDNVPESHGLRVVVQDSKYNYALVGDMIDAMYVNGTTCENTSSASFESTSPNSSNPSTKSSGSHHTNLAAILAPVLSVTFVGGLLFVGWLWMRKQRRIRLTETSKWKSKLDKNWRSNELNEEQGKYNSMDGTNREKDSVDFVRKV